LLLWHGFYSHSPAHYGPVSACPPLRVQPQPTEGPHGPILKARRNTINNLAGFDLVALQTEQQRDTLATRGIDTTNTRIIPSSLPAEAYTADDDQNRNESAGTIVATLSELKRVDHAIRAIHATREDGTGVSLQVCGDGVERRNLEALVDELSLEGSVKFLGQVSDVPERLAASSFSLLTSTSEGHPLVLIESMAAGCIPIFYDIAYGPRDIITHGVNGFIVPYGDIGALAATIKEFIALPSSERESMRQAAVERAGDYSPARSFERWSSVLKTLAPGPVHASE
ncbi:glycosyltransferase, partial [Ancrocorticia sp.]|uniref:glycosyltransferase n=1 Tax=Ancrocorticia sp. TaxID=2593684 RepID=UPI003F93ECDD